MHSSSAIIPGADKPLLSPSATALLLTSIFFVLSLIGIRFHEIWLDEAQHFLLARDSTSLPDLIHRCRYEGHPVLWNILLFILTRFTDEVYFMQLLHIMINCITVYLIAKSRISLFIKVSLVFSYFIFFEYNLISRNYGLSTLFIFLAVHLYLRRTPSLIWFSAVVFALANSHLYALLFSIVLIAGLFLYDRPYFSRPKLQIIIAAVLIITGWLIASLSIIPPLDYGKTFTAYDTSSYFSHDRLLKTFSSCLKGLFYIPDYNTSGQHIQNSFYLFQHLTSPWQIYLASFIALALPFVALRKHKLACAIYLLFLALYTCFIYFLPLVNGVRYFGFFFIVFIVCARMARENMSRGGKAIAVLIIALQFINGIYFYMMDLKYPFSTSRQTDVFLSSVDAANSEVLFLDRTLRPPVSAYNGRKYFGIETGRQMSYCEWHAAMPEHLLKSAVDSILSANTRTLIITRGQLNVDIDTSSMTLLKKLEHALLRESVLIYEYKK